ncbi:sensor histidine kinase [Azospirillum thermophilum]|uniref:histidine kinase n=1 Tax=Azospirillum thermophilum TaxID=2202148 RepID=A0A2S2CST8_9PROT|nr:HAMP domain-containing sensor histidine kinase [Azospirillum thermophilum]AWK87562.1 hypothetical protein DEW08_16240 [Azospirillum thermophilum]
MPTAVSPLYAATNRPMILLALVISLVSLLLIVRLMLRDREDVGIRYYFVGLVVALAGLVVTQLALRGVLPAGGVYVNAYQIGSATHVVILAAGLSHRVRRLQADRIRARQESAFAMKRAEQQRTFVAMLSHEFRTPLASIDSAAQMIAETAGPLPAKAMARLERIRATARRLGGLVDLFLSSEALDQGALALHPERVALRDLLDSALETAASGAEDRIRRPAEGQDRVLRADPHFLGVAIGNLVQNALRYSPPGAPVEIAAAWEPDGLAISVRDHGRGMSADEVERVGSMYFRASSSKGTKGAGIGLYITRQIVAAHGGTLQVQSRPGEGSVFTIRLPQRPAA